MVKKVNKKIKIDPLHMTVCLIIIVGVLIIILIKRYFKKTKKPEDENIDLQSLINEDIKQSNTKKLEKKKPRVKEVNKGSGFIPEKNKFKEIDSTMSNNLISKNIIDINTNLNLPIEKSQKKQVKGSDYKKVIPNKDIQFLNENEKDGLYSLMGLVSNNHETNRIETILSVEYLFDTKFKHNNKVEKSNLSLNDYINDEAKRVENLKDLSKILNEYNQAIDNEIIISSVTLINLLSACLKLEEINHASFFLTELDKYNYKIPRNILEQFMDLKITINVLQNKIKEQNKKTNIIIQNKFDQSAKKLILPNNNSYLQNPEYFYFKSKKETYKGLNILNTIHSLNVNSGPFFPVDNKKMKEQKEIKEIKIETSNISNEQNSYNTINNTHLKSNPQTNDELNENIKKIRNFNIDEIKEYIPKKYKLVSKDNTFDNNIKK